MSDLQLKVTLSAIDKITAPLRGIAKQSQRLSQGYKTDMGSYNTTLKQTEKALEGVRATQRRMAQAGQPLSRASIEAEQALVRRINETNSALNRRRELMDREMGAIRRRQAAMDRGKSQMMRGTVMMGMATGATYAGARIMQPGFDFEEQMSKVQALTRLNKDDPMLEKLKEQAKLLGATTWASATQAADAQSFYAMSGFDPEAIMDALPSTLDLAKAGGVDVGRAADIGSNILSAFGLDPSEMTKVSDVLVSIFTRTNTSIESLGETMKYVAPIANKLNIPLEETAAMAGILGNIGIQGSQAGTSLKTLAVNLAAPTGRALKALEALNIETKDASGNFRGMPDIIIDMIKATEKMGDAERLGYLTDIAGKEAAAGFAGFIDENGYDEFIKIIDAAYNAQGESARVAAVMSDNLKGDWTGFMSAIESVQIGVAELDNKSMRSLIQRITKLTQGISNWIKENPKLAGTIFKVTAAIIGIIAGLGALSIAMAIFNMTVLANPIVLIIAAILAAIVALIYYKDEIWDFFKAFADAPRHYIHKTVRYMNGLLDSISEWISRIPLVGPAAQLVFEALAFNLRIIYYLIGKITDAFALIGNTWVSPTIDTSSIENVWDLIQSGFNFILDLRNSISDLLGEIPVIGPALQIVFDLFTFTFALIIQIVKKMIEAFEWISGNATAIGGIFVAMWDSIVQAAQPVVKLFEWIMDMISKITTGIADAFSFEKPAWMQTTGSFLGDTYDYFADSLSYTGGLIGDHMDGVFGRNSNVATMATTPAVPVNNRTTMNHQEVKVEVHATTNASPQVIGGAIAAAIKKQSFMGDEY